MLKRRPRRSRAGITLLGSLMALTLFGIVSLGAMEWLHDRARERQASLAGEQMELLADAVGVLVQGTFPARLTAAPEEITLADVRGVGALPLTFAPNGVDALGRRYRILTTSPRPNTVDVLVTATVPPGDTILPAAALRAVSARTRIGIVFPGEAPATLRGPAIAEPVTDWRTRFSGAPQARALAILQRHDHQSVFGDYLYRGTVPGLNNANTMSTALDLGGNNITNAGDIAAAELTVDQNLVVRGSLTVDQNLIVDGRLTAGSATMSGRLAVDAANVTGGLSARSANITGQLNASGITTSRGVSADTISATGTLDAASASISGAATAGSVIAPTVTVSGGMTATNASATTMTVTNSVTASSATVAGRLEAGSVSATGRLDARTGGFTSLTVGSCSGC